MIPIIIISPFPLASMYMSLDGWVRSYSHPMREKRRGKEEWHCCHLSHSLLFCTLHTYLFALICSLIYVISALVIIVCVIRKGLPPPPLPTHTHTVRIIIIHSSPPFPTTSTYPLSSPVGQWDLNRQERTATDRSFHHLPSFFHHHFGFLCTHTFRLHLFPFFLLVDGVPPGIHTFAHTATAHAPLRAAWLMYHISPFRLPSLGRIPGFLPSPPQSFYTPCMGWSSSSFEMGPEFRSVFVKRALAPPSPPQNLSHLYKRLRHGNGMHLSLQIPSDDDDDDDGNYTW